MKNPKYPVPPLEKRLQGRYRQMVNEQLHPNTDVAAGAKALPSATAQAFAATQAAWRFYAHEETTLPALSAPLLQAARTALATSHSASALVLHDLSHLNYHTHTRKRDRTPLSGPHELGYELQTALLVEAVTGQPLAPVYQSLAAAAGQYSTASPNVAPAQAMTDAVTTALGIVAGLALGKQLVHIIDREADSVFHLRQWAAAEQLFVVRADNERLVRYGDREGSLPQVAQDLQPQMKAVRTISFHGQRATQFVAEAAIRLERPACLHRVVDGQRKRLKIAGAPLALRLVVSEIRAADGTRLAQWLLLTNVPRRVSAARLAQWYYWRWRIESYFKLLKSAGHEIEHWQQTTALAVAKRLLLAGMACVVVWHLARDPSAQAATFRAALVRLSGRQMKSGCAFTATALLAGLGHLLPMLALLEEYDLQEIKDLAADCLPGIYPLRR